MKLKWVSLISSTIIIAAAFILVLTGWADFKKGIDFAGGVKIEAETNDQVSIDNLRSAFDQIKIPASVQSAGKGIENLARIEVGGQEITDLETRLVTDQEFKKADSDQNTVSYLKFLLARAINSNNPPELKFVNSDFVGPTVGDYLQKSAVKLLFVTLLLIIIYIILTFKRFAFAFGAMIALIHDLLMTLGFIAIFQVPLSIPVVAALLTILGYSINDTIIIFDRIRENSRGEEGTDFEGIINKSINDSLSRTINTSLTTILAVTAIYIFGGEGLSDMALVMIVGIIIGTYSSSFIASPLLWVWHRYRT